LLAAGFGVCLPHQQTGPTADYQRILWPEPVPAAGSHRLQQPVEIVSVEELTGFSKLRAANQSPVNTGTSLRNGRSLLGAMIRGLRTNCICNSSADDRADMLATVLLVLDA
jgi:hypothetical protein